MAVNDEDKLEDFGEHIAGAKKETYSRYDFNNKDLSNDDVRKLPMSKLWAKNDIDSIEDNKTAAIAHVLRDSVGNKPRSEYKVKRWFDRLQDAQDVVRSLTDDHSIDSEDYIAAIENDGIAQGFKMRLLSEIERKHWSAINDVMLSRRFITTNEGIRELDASKIHLTVRTKSGTLEGSFDVPTNDQINVVDARRAIQSFAKDFDARYQKLEQRSQMPSARDFAIYKTRSSVDEPYFIVSRSDKNKSPLVHFATIDEARAYRDSRIDDLTKIWEEHKENHNVKKSDMRSRENEPRSGAYYRDGRDITPEEFMDTFNIRGGQFGNWVNNEERTAMLNNAYDGFMDLSVAANIPPRAIGLSGTLGIAFGARGSGWAAAHYETGGNVINLTKTKGAGSLAHEWWHALDHYMGGRDLLTRNNRTDTIRHEELRQPVLDMMLTMKKSSYQNRSNNADGYRNKPYFGTTVEMTARAFETHVVAKLADLNIKNQWLANVVPAGNWVKDDSVYPYPTKDEVKEFAKHYEQVFDTLAEYDRSFERTENPAERLIVQQQEDKERLQASTNTVVTKKPELATPDKNNDTPNESVSTLGNSRPDQYLQGISDRLMQQIRENKAPWQQPIQAGAINQIMPVNRDGKPYSGLNVVNLMSQAIDKGYTDNRWYTFNGAKDEGGKVKKGEKGTKIHYWQFTKTVKDDNGKSVEVKLDRPIFRQFTVFNAEQIEGLPERKNTIEPLTDFERHEKAESILANFGANIVHDNGKGQTAFAAFYTPANDTITLPNKKYFKSENDYYATALHEVAHATGHESRLNRDLSGAFGSYEYAKEELRAELASMFLNEHIQVGYDPQNHIAYMQHWAKLLENDPKEFFRATRDADRIASYILTFDKTKEVAKEVDTKAVESRDITNSKVQLYVPFDDKDQAHQLGAKWDNDNKTWYAPAGSDLSKFTKWREPPRDTSISPEVEFADYLKSKGVDVRPGHPILDGKFHRLPHETDKDGKKSASYVVHTDNGIPRGYYRNFKTGEEEKWVSSQRTQTITPKIDPEAIKAQAEAKQYAQYDAVANIAQGIYHHAIAANPNHGYLTKKQVTANNVVKSVPSNDQLPPELQSQVIIGSNWRESKALRDNPNEHRIVLTQGDLVVPVQNKDGEVRSIQTIAENGFKGYLKGGEKSGNYAVIGQVENGKPFVIAEGYSTAATIHEQTGQPVIVAFDKNNLSNAGQALREQNPDSRIYFAADNDHQTAAKLIAQGRTNGELNGGIEQAHAAAKAIDGYVLIPSFDPHEKGSDWNDIFVDKGVDEFKRQMREQVIKSRGLDTNAKLNITLKNFSDPDLAKVQDNVVKLAVENTNFLLEKYSKMSDTYEGRYIASDMMKEVFDEYNQSSESRNRLNNVVHNTAAALAAEQFKKMVGSPPQYEKNTVVMLTGSPGSGKTSAVVDQLQVKQNVAVVYEGQLANGSHPSTIAKFEQALKSGYKVDIVAVNPKPEQALENTFKRFYDPNDGRGSPIATMAKIQGNSYEGLKAIHDKFGDQVSLTIIDKPNGNDSQIKYQGWEHLDVLKSQGTEKQIQQRLETHLFNHYKEGTIDYECFKQAAGSAERAKSMGTRMDGQHAQKSHPHEPKRSLPQSDSRQSDQLGQRVSQTSPSRQTGIREQISQRRDTLLNHPKLTQEQKNTLNYFVKAVDVSVDDASKLQTYNQLVNKIDDIATGKIQLPNPPTPPGHDVKR